MTDKREELVERVRDMRDFCESGDLRPHPRYVARLCDDVLAALGAIPVEPTEVMRELVNSRFWHGSYDDARDILAASRDTDSIGH